MRMVERTSEDTLVERILSTIKTADGVFAVGDDQRIGQWSATAERILGHTAEAVLQHPCQDIIAGLDARNARFCRDDCRVMGNARKGRPTPAYDVLVQAADGSTKWLNMSVLVVQDPETHTTSVLHLFRDVTLHRRLEEQARQMVATVREAVPAEEQHLQEESAVPPTTPRQLSARELEVLRLLFTGLTTEQIGESLGISTITARNHITNLRGKLGVKTQLQAVLYASQHQLV